MISFCYWMSQIHHNFSFMTNLWQKSVRHRSRVTLEILWWFSQNVIKVVWYVMKTECYRTILACVAGGLPRWWVLPLKMLSTCTCYSQLHWRWFRYVSPSYCTTWPSLVLAHFRFLLDHVSCSYCSTCQVFMGTHVVLRLDHVSLLHWTMWRNFIGPRGRFLFDHASRKCLSMFCLFIWPCGVMTSFHVLYF
jgi:hypothetical protein